MTRRRNEPETLVKGGTPAERRAYAGQKLASDPIDVTDGALGWATGNHDNLHMTIKVPTTSSSIDWTLYTWSRAAQLWRVHPTIGTITVTDAQSPDASEIGIAGAQRVHLQFSTPVNLVGDGVDVWLEGSTL